MSLLDLTILTRERTGQAALDTAAAVVFANFLERADEFGFNPDVIVDYPDIDDLATSPLVVDPVGYIDRRMAASVRPVSRVLLLTTHGDRLLPPLAAAGYGDMRVAMPAGPAFACVSLVRDEQDGITLYIEAVDETGPGIRPDFVLEMRDDGDRLRGGACGSVRGRYAYLSIMSLEAGLPRGTGRRLAEALLTHLRSRGVDTVHLGTQTAGPFYARLGFAVTHTLVRDLRVRRGANGRRIATDLQMMELRL